MDRQTNRHTMNIEYNNPYLAFGSWKWRRTQSRVSSALENGVSLGSYIDAGKYKVCK